MNDLLTFFPWIVLAGVILADKASEWRLIGILSRLVEKQAAPAVAPAAVAPHAPAATVAAPPVAPIAPPAAKPPAAPGAFPGAPAWFQWAVHEIGFRETGSNQGIERYIGLAHTGAVGDPWCAIFANAALEASGVPGSRSASSQSFRTHPDFVQLSQPALGCIVVFWRGAQNSGLGHVGFYRGEDASRVWTLGGNESDMVEIAALPKSSATFGLVGYWWPKSVPPPTTGPVMMPAGSPATVRAPPIPSKPAPGGGPGGKQNSIVATMFGGQQSAYGGPIDDNSPGVALPFRFKGTRPRVRVTNPKTGASVDCDIVDVGPWNINDPYWETGARPEAETGTDMTGRSTNKAGIDLTFAAAKAVAIDGKGLVDWEFLTSPATTTTTTTVT